MSQDMKISHQILQLKALQSGLLKFINQIHERFEQVGAACDIETDLCTPNVVFKLQYSKSLQTLRVTATQNCDGDTNTSNSWEENLYLDAKAQIPLKLWIQSLSWYKVSKIQLLITEQSNYINLRNKLYMLLSKMGIDNRQDMPILTNAELQSDYVPEDNYNDDQYILRYQFSQTTKAEIRKLANNIQFAINNISTQAKRYRQEIYEFWNPLRKLSVMFPTDSWIQQIAKKLSDQFVELLVTDKNQIICQVAEACYSYLTRDQKTYDAETFIHIFPIGYIEIIFSFINQKLKELILIAHNLIDEINCHKNSQQYTFKVLEIIRVFNGKRQQDIVRSNCPSRQNFTTIYQLICSLIQKGDQQILDKNEKSIFQHEEYYGQDQDSSQTYSNQSEFKLSDGQSCEDHCDINIIEIQSSNDQIEPNGDNEYRVQSYAFIQHQYTAVVSTITHQQPFPIRRFLELITFMQKYKEDGFKIKGLEQDSNAIEVEEELMNLNNSIINDI